MEQQVIFRDRQELQAADQNNLQSFTDASIRHLISDAVTAERQVTGLIVTGRSATELEVAPGRLWVGDTGKVYRLDSAMTLSLFGHLPITDTRWLAVAAIGQEIETDTQPRDFLIDLQTNQTEPRVVAMEQLRQIAIIITPGTESVEPQKPFPPTGQTPLAYVLLQPSGIVSTTDARPVLPQLQNQAQRVSNIEVWRSRAEPTISTLSSDVAALAQSARNAAQTANIKELAADVARLKEAAQLPDTLVSYGADYYLTETESDTGDTEYAARVDEGIRMPWEAQALSALQLFNPLESAVVNKGGLLLPTYTEEPRLSLVGDVAGSLSLGQYQYQTITIRQGTLSRTVIRYGPTRDYCTNSGWWQTGQYDPITHIFVRAGETYEVLTGVDPTTTHAIRVRQFWRDTIVEPYWHEVSTTNNVQGSVIAQTVLNSQAGWLTGIGLYLTERASGGGLTVVVCETVNGMPDMTRTLAQATLTEAALQLYPAETRVTFARPIFLSSGRRYAVIIITPVAHKAALIEGSLYSHGTLLYSTDGAYFLGDLTKDLMLRLYVARFTNPFVQIQLQPLSLAGGIADIVLRFGAFAPEISQLVWEVQHQGMWRTINAESAPLLVGLPAMLLHRVSFVGTSDLMPALELQGSTVQVARPATTFTHLSTERTLAAATTSIEVQLLLEAWDATKHTCTVSLRSGVTTYTPTSVSDKIINATSIRRKATFTVALPGISTYQVKVVGTSTTPLTLFHVAERIDIAF